MDIGVTQDELRGLFPQSACQMFSSLSKRARFGAFGFQKSGGLYRYRVIESLFHNAGKESLNRITPVRREVLARDAARDCRGEFGAVKPFQGCPKFDPLTV